MSVTMGRPRISICTRQMKGRLWMQVDWKIESKSKFLDACAVVFLKELPHNKFSLTKESVHDLYCLKYWQGGSEPKLYYVYITVSLVMTNKWGIAFFLLIASVLRYTKESETSYWRWGQPQVKGPKLVKKTKTTLAVISNFIFFCGGPPSTFARLR